MTERQRHYTLRQTIDNAVDARLASVHVACPARVLSYDAEKQRIDAQPLVQIVFANEAGERKVESLPVVTNVPVIHPGSGGFRLTFPVEVDDTVLLVFAESSIDKWLESGAVVDPLDDRRFHLSDGVAVLGFRDFAHALTSAPVDRMTLGKDDGIQIHIQSDRINLGSNDPSKLEKVGCGESILAAIQSISDKLSSHTHPGVLAGMASTGPSVNASPTVGSLVSPDVYVTKQAH